MIGRFVLAFAAVLAYLGVWALVLLPVAVAERGRKLVPTWRYVDAKWWDVLSKSGLRSVYELHVKLDDHRNLATLVDVQKSVRWSVGPGRVWVWGGFFRGVMLDYSIGAQWGIKENFEVGRIYAFRFHPAEIKNPVMNSILRSGWDVRFGLW